MSKTKATKAVSIPVWITRSEAGYKFIFWLSKPRKEFRSDQWDYTRINIGVCSEVYMRKFPKAMKLKPGGGPLECVLTVKGKAQT